MFIFIAHHNQRNFIMKYRFILL
ncbi:CHRD domain-containing protein, partial [Brucella abortus]